MAEHGARARRIPPAMVLPLSAGVFYGLIVRLSFSQSLSQGIVQTLSLGFLTLVPLATGALTVFLYERKNRSMTFGQAFFQAQLTMLVFLAVVGLLAIELVICLLMALPILALFAGLGGVVMLWLLRTARRWNRRKNSPGAVLAMLLLAPYMLTPLEMRFTPQTLTQTVETTIMINATPQAVWEPIIRVPEIASHEQRLSLFQILGVPRPIEAVLETEGVGGVRYGKFVDGVVFNETITVWEPSHEIAFDISVRARPQHGGVLAEIGGPFFDVSGARYQIEAFETDKVLLRLSGTYRLSTNFNGYGRLWIDLIMGDFQRYILGVVKSRAETAS